MTYKYRPSFKPTSKRYAKQHGQCCPICESYGSLIKGVPRSAQHVDGSYMKGTWEAEVVCATCNSAWNEVTRITGYINMKRGDKIGTKK